MKLGNVTHIKRNGPNFYAVRQATVCCGRHDHPAQFEELISKELAWAIIAGEGGTVDKNDKQDWVVMLPKPLDLVMFAEYHRSLKCRIIAIGDQDGFTAVAPPYEEELAALEDLEATYNSLDVVR